MVYTLDKIETVADCDQLIASVNKEMEDLAYQETTLERKQKAYAESATAIQLQLTNSKSELVGLRNLISGLPDGPNKDSYVDKKVKLEYKIYTLEASKKTNGVIAMLENQFDVNKLERQKEEVNAFKAALLLRKAALQAAVVPAVQMGVAA